MTVSDMDASVAFYSQVLSFEKVSDVEVTGEDYERLQGVFGLRMRVVRMRLGAEFIELTEYLTPKGRPVPVDSRSNDRWFQHIAIITSDMNKAYAVLRQNKVEHASTGPQRLPDWNKNAGGIEAFYFRDPDKHWPNFATLLTDDDGYDAQEAWQSEGYRWGYSQIDIAGEAADTAAVSVTRPDGRVVVVDLDSLSIYHDYLGGGGAVKHTTRSHPLLGDSSKAVGHA